MATPFSQAPVQDPRREAALQGLRDRANPQGPSPQPAPAGQVPGGGTEQIGALLAQVFQLISSSPPEMLEANIGQVQQFFMALQELGGQQGQVPQGQAPGPGPAPPQAGPPL